MDSVHATLSYIKRSIHNNVIYHLDLPPFDHIAYDVDQEGLIDGHHHFTIRGAIATQHSICLISRKYQFSMTLGVGNFKFVQFVFNRLTPATNMICNRNVMIVFHKLSFYFKISRYKFKNQSIQILNL